MKTLTRKSMKLREKAHFSVKKQLYRYVIIFNHWRLFLWKAFTTTTTVTSLRTNPLIYQVKLNWKICVPLFILLYSLLLTLLHVSPSRRPFHPHSSVLYLKQLRSTSSSWSEILTDNSSSLLDICACSFYLDWFSHNFTQSDFSSSQNKPCRNVWQLIIARERSWCLFFVLTMQKIYRWHDRVTFWFV